MTATDDELAEISDYLAKNFPKASHAKINVNKATALENQLRLGFSASGAKSIAEYRVKNGDFKFLDDVKKVPYVDDKKTVEKKAIWAF